MFCQNCGTQNPDNVTFCQQCGSRIEPPTAPAQTASPAATPVFQPAAPTVQYPNYTPAQPIVKAPVIRSSNPAVNALKNLMASPLFIVAAVSYSVYLFFYLISAMVDTNSIFSSLQNYFGLLGVDIPYEVNSIFNTFQGTVTATKILGIIPNIIIAVGIWMTFAFAIQKNNDAMKTSGFTTIKVIGIINLVSSIVLATLVGILMIIGLISIITAASKVNDYGYYSSAVSTVSSVSIGLYVFLIIVAAGIFTFTIIYRSKIVKTINAVSQTAFTGVPNEGVSGFVAVMCFISGGFTALSVFSASDVASVFSILAHATATICFGVGIFAYKNKMRELLAPSFNPINQTVAAQSVQAPQ